MSREIKFRAWDSRYKKMIFTGFHLLGEVMAFAQIEDYCLKHKGLEEPSILRWNDIIIMQFTGLKGKNGKEIYEGDIVAESGLTVPDIISVVEWGEYPADDQGESSVMHGWVINSKIYGIRPLVPYSCTEVIGTVYENPELLR